MLVLGRKLGESIRIGDDIYIKLIRYDADRKQVQIGIDAPKDINIVRTEIDDKRN